MRVFIASTLLIKQNYSIREESFRETLSKPTSEGEGFIRAFRYMIIILRVNQHLDVSRKLSLRDLQFSSEEGKYVSQEVRQSFKNWIFFGGIFRTIKNLKIDMLIIILFIVTTICLVVAPCDGETCNLAFKRLVFQTHRGL